MESKEYYVIETWARLYISRVGGYTPGWNNLDSLELDDNPNKAIQFETKEDATALLSMLINTYAIDIACDIKKVEVKVGVVPKE